MPASIFRSAMCTALIAAVISSCYSQSYTDLESLGVNCPARDRCGNYGNRLTYMDRNCECDDNCTAYEDCCIDALPNATTQSSRPPPRTDVTCLHYGEYKHAGVYVINKCSSSWNGPREVREQCVGGDDFSNPLSAAPITDVLRNKTYRNLACAKCNNANLSSLKTFAMRLKCPGIDGHTHEEIMNDLIYNEELRSWGVNRLNANGDGTHFIHCNIIYDVQGYLNNSVRFCRSNLVSTCAENWQRPEVASLCSQYMTVSYSNTLAYKNPHCALCNHQTTDDISCEQFALGRNPTRPFSFVDRCPPPCRVARELASRQEMLGSNPTSGMNARSASIPFVALLDFHVNLMDFSPFDRGELVGMEKVDIPKCSSGYKYDPFFKRCRRIVCALPGHFLKDGRCRKA